MASDEFVDSTIANLKVIGMVPRNGRLCVRKGQLCLDTNDVTQPLRRWSRGDSRDLTLLHVRNTLSNAARIAALLGPSAETSPARAWALRQIAAELTQCEVGLCNLRTTYAEDSIMVASIGVLIARVQAQRAHLVRTYAATLSEAAGSPDVGGASAAPADADAANVLLRATSESDQEH